MKSLLLWAVTAAITVSLVLSAPPPASAQQVISATLDGYEETPSISTRGNGVFRGVISADEQSISYLLVYFDLEGQVTAAHLHLGQPAIAGGVAAFLCGGGGKPTCPAPGVTVTGTLTAADVIGPSSQGMAAGELVELIRAIRRGAAYANVHSSLQTAGEIRGQIK